MLTEKERKTLKDIERHLGVEDPKLAHALERGSAKALHHRGTWEYVVTAFTVAALLAVLAIGIVLALPVLVFVAAMLAGVALGAQWLHREWVAQRPRRR